MLIQGSGPLDQLKKSQPRLAAWEIQPQALASALLHANPRLGTRNYLVDIGAFDARAPQDEKGQAGDRSPWEADRFLVHAYAESLGDEGLHSVYYQEQKEKISNGFVRTDRSARQAPVKISQAAHIGKDRIVASRESVVWLQCFEPR